jgi:3-phosphoshikimate 1-carboxyvinyltransferase
MLAAIATGTSRFEGFSTGADATATLNCLRQLGVSIREWPQGAARTVEVEGRGWRGFAAPGHALDAGNSGTTMRLLAGLLAAHPFSTTVTGDASLRRRPMQRVIDPLTRMGARFDAPGGRPPLTVIGGDLAAIDFQTTIPSAQVKSAILLAGLHAKGRTLVTEPAPTRDHTERALDAFGARVLYGPGWAAVDLSDSLHAVQGSVPGDPSAAAFWAVAAAALPGSEIEIAGIGLNPTRLGFLEALRRMGAWIDVEADTVWAGEPVGRLLVRHDTVGCLAIGPGEVPGLIDELPALAALATFGGELTVSGAAELRVKESDRITSLVAGLCALGADAEERPDGFVVRGAHRLRGGRAHAAGDHRLAMALAIAALGADAASEITDAGSVDISYPGFFTTLRSLCA